MILGKNFARFIGTIDAIYIFVASVYIINTLVYFVVFVVFAILLGENQIIHIPLAASNLMSLLLLSFAIPKWKFKDEIEDFSPKTWVGKLRWSVILTFPAALFTTASLFLHLEITLQILVVLVNAFHLECLIIFSKTASKNRGT